MDFTFSPEQVALRDAVRSFLVAEAPNDYVRRMAEHDDAGVTAEVWRKIVDLGWTGLLGVSVFDQPSALGKTAKVIYDTQHLELSALPESPESQDYIELHELPN